MHAQDGADALPAQGVFDLRVSGQEEPMAVRSATTEAMVDSTGRPVSDDEMRMRLRDLRDRVQRTLSGARE